MDVNSEPAGKAVALGRHSSRSPSRLPSMNRWSGVRPLHPPGCLSGHEALVRRQALVCSRCTAMAVQQASCPEMAHKAPIKHSRVRQRCRCGAPEQGRAAGATVTCRQHPALPCSRCSTHASAGTGLGKLDDALPDEARHGQCPFIHAHQHRRSPKQSVPGCEPGLPARPASSCPRQCPAQSTSL